MSQYDFIVVGGGSAGSCVAARLTESPARVLVLEAGGPTIPANVDNPSLWYTLFHSDVDWAYQSVPQPGLNGRKTYEPRGKLLGGTSNLYLMMHIRGHRADYDNWAYSGCPGWSYRDVLPYFRKIEDQEDEDTPWAGKGGPLHLANAGRHDPNPTSAAFIDACKELGYPFTPDFNGPRMEGVGWHHIAVKNGRRHSDYRAYLEPAMKRPNLTVEVRAQATRLLFDGRRCVGVEYRQGETRKSAWADAEVVVCGGALETPRLLLLSGVGNPDHLRSFDIPVVSPLRGVGENFHNHVLVGVSAEAPRPTPPGRQNLSEAALYWKSSPGWVGPDLQFSFVHVPFNIIVGRGHPNSVSILPGVVRPMSRGWVRLASANPLDEPLLNPNYLGASSDLDRLVEAVTVCRDIFGARAFRPWYKQELTPGPEVKSPDQLRAFVRDNADSYHHQVGSCKMGSDETSVVGPDLRVYGVEGLRVADASVMPAVPSGNCHAAVLMIAERASDLIKNAHGFAT